MDIDTHVNQIVQNIISEITGKVQAQVAGTISQKIDEVINAIDYSALMSTKMNQKIDDKLGQLSIDKNSIETLLSTRVEALAETISIGVNKQIQDKINTNIAGFLNHVDFTKVYQSSIISALQQNQFAFPENSVPSSALNLEGFVISGDNIKNGIITGFGSTGIDDKASSCQLTIMDDVTVVENNLLTQNLTVKGTATIEGDLNVTGSVPETSAFFINLVNAATTNVRTSLDQVVFSSYADMVTESIKANGLDLTKITVDGNEIVNNNALGKYIVNSNLQKLGTLQELQVGGETLLGGTLYVNNKRVGINTLEPDAALNVWDQEVELRFSKQSNNVGILETPRSQTLILSSNGKNNAVLNPDGSITVNKINMNGISIASSPTPPADDQPHGSIVFNSSPSLGGPMGWISLGDARWANFGIVD
jgi:hypothetical protein